jgi:hypothetical protein
MVYCPGPSKAELWPSIALVFFIFSCCAAFAERGKRGGYQSTNKLASTRLCGPWLEDFRMEVTGG